MKRILLFLLGVSAVILAASCSDNDKYGARPKVTFKALAADGSEWIDVATVYVGKDGRVAVKDVPTINRYNPSSSKVPVLQSVKLKNDVKINENLLCAKGASATSMVDVDSDEYPVLWILNKEGTEYEYSGLDFDFSIQKFTEDTVLYASYSFGIEVNFYCLDNTGIWVLVETLETEDKKIEIDSVPKVEDEFALNVKINDIAGKIKLGENDYKGVAKDADNTDSIDKTVDAEDELTVYTDSDKAVWVGADNKVFALTQDTEFTESTDLYILYKVDQK